ncbi:MAG TPA: hypothetical protein VFH47_04335, partial [Candidatus Thermoplasmatota archaeon]|nr:hypothetical protein [Candidatus Thermoplasmatota archaeon]
TTTGESGTSATTTGVLPLLNAQLNVLKLQRAGGAWDARLVLTGVTGEISTDLVTVQLAGATTSTQVVVRLGEDQTTGAPVALDAATGTVNVLTFGTCLGTCTLTMSIVLAPKGGAQPVLTYSYVLTVT